MSSQPVSHILPEWTRREVVSFAGMFDTNIDTGADYDTIALARIFTMQPGSEAKGSGLAMIPSTYCGHDAREHATQRREGSYVALTGDIDSGNHPLALVEELVRAICGESAWLIYSSAHARPGAMRWRIVIPIARPIAHDDWHDAQTAFFNYMEAHDVAMDRALARAAQPVYLPNVPRSHPKTGEALRGEDDAPLHYQQAATPLTAPALELDKGIIATYISDVLRKHAADERERERLRKQAEERRAAMPAGEGANIIADFNRANPIPALLEHYGYTRSLRHQDDWRSPNQTSESYATRVYGDKWVSLSASDLGLRIGAQHRSGCYGDAYDLFVHYEHGGDHKAAFRALHAERRAAAMSFAAPPPRQADDPGPQECDIVPDVADYEDYGFDGEPQPTDEADDFHTVDAFDFDESAIPPRPWVIPGVMLAGYTHMLVAPGGSGKSLFTLQMAITLATGDAWGDMAPRRKCRTLVINVEDDMDEQRRRLSAARRVMDKDVAELRGMIDLAEDPESIIVARADPNRKTVVATPVVDTLRRFIIDRGIGVLIVDPFAETFEGDENSNSEVKWAMRIWRDQIARATGCAVYLVHHTIKGADNGAGNADIVRGAGSIVNSTRITATLMPMSTNDAEALGIDPPDRYRFVRYDDAKANQSLKSGRARWFEKVTVELSNGSDDSPPDEVGALRPWRPPNPFDGVTLSHLKRVQQIVGEGRWRENPQANEWVGYAVAEAMMLDANDAKDRKRIVSLLREWIKNDVLRIVIDEDSKRNKRKFVEVGEWVEN